MTSLRNHYSGRNPIFCLKVDLAESLYNTCLLLGHIHKTECIRMEKPKNQEHSKLLLLPIIL